MAGYKKYIDKKKSLVHTTETAKQTTFSDEVDTHLALEPVFKPGTRYNQGQSDAVAREKALSAKNTLPVRLFTDK